VHKHNSRDWQRRPTGPSRATTGPGETFSWGFSGRKFFGIFFLKWRILVYLILLSDGRVPKRCGAWGKLPLYPSLPPLTGLTTYRSTMDEFKTFQRHHASVGQFLDTFCIKENRNWYGNEQFGSKNPRDNIIRLIKFVNIYN